MKNPFVVIAAIAAILLGSAGCGHLDLKPEGSPNRVATGSVKVRMNLLPPADSEVVVRIVQPPDITAAPTAASGITIGERGSRERPEQVVAEQVIHAPAALPVSYRIEFRADDAQLRRGLNIEARISWGGRLRFRNLEAQAITVGTLDQPQDIWVEPVR
jgi:uncharacterized lipoprotein YbaY